MKLLTEMRPTDCAEFDVWAKRDFDKDHDSAAAHALMQAMEEEYAAAKTSHSGVRQEWITRYKAMHDVKNRADEIMCGWGFNP